MKVGRKCGIRESLEKKYLSDTNLTCHDMYIPRSLFDTWFPSGIKDSHIVSIDSFDAPDALHTTFEPSQSYEEAVLNNVHDMHGPGSVNFASDMPILSNAYARIMCHKNFDEDFLITPNLSRSLQLPIENKKAYLRFHIPKETIIPMLAEEVELKRVCDHKVHPSSEEERLAFDGYFSIPQVFNTFLSINQTIN